jgi:hypothetical protein
MAYTKTNAIQSVYGNKRAVTLEVTADAASGAVDTGLGFIECVTTGLKSAGSAGPRFKANQNSAPRRFGARCSCRAARPATCSM